jgi:hypothetical protein
MRLLEARGIFCYLVAGSMIVADRQGDVFGFHCVDELDPGATQAGHVWLVAPPYSVVDPTIGRQRRQYNMGLPGVLLGEGFVDGYVVTQSDVVAPLQLGVRRADLPDFQRLANKLGVVRFDGGAWSARYIPQQATAPDVPLEELPDHLNLGTSPADAVAGYIAPVDLGP